MSIKTSIIFLLLLGILLSSCNNEEVIITKMEISSQADIDYICDNLPDSDTFIGSILITTDVILDYKCLTNLKHIKGRLILEGPETSKAFRNIETIVSRDVFVDNMIDYFSVSDPAVDIMSFPELRIVENIFIDNVTNFGNTLYLPEVDSIEIFIIEEPINGTRSGTIIGLNKVEEIIELTISNYWGGEKIKIDGFANLKKAVVVDLSNINEYFEISESSFNNLEEVNFMNMRNTSISELDYTFEFMFPNLKIGQFIRLRDFDPMELCYLKDYLASGDVNIDIRNSMTNEEYNNNSLIELCD